jgi:branched-chain amino acid transport system permease protein
MVGAYLCYAIVGSVGNFWIALALVPLLVGVVAWAAEPGVRRLYALPAGLQILATLGIALIIQEVVILIFDPIGKNVTAPESLNGAIFVGSFVYPKYRLFVILFTALMAAVLWFLLERTRYGAVLRAGTESMQTVELLGINIGRVFSLTFAIGAALTALSGVLVAPIRGAEPFMSMEALAIAFVIIVIGGIGSFTGALVGGLLIGVVQSLMTIFWPAGANIMIYVAMALIVLLRPHGLLGRA